MRVLYLTDSYRPARSACANRAVVLVEALRSAGHDVQVLASSDSLIGVPANYEQPDYVTFFETFPLKEKTLANRLKNNFGGCRASVRAAYGMGAFDVVVCTTPPLLLIASAMRIARARRAKLVWDIRDVWPDVAYEMGSFSPGSVYGRFFAFLAKRGYRVADLVVTVSPGKVEKLRGRVSDGCVALVPNGVDEGFPAGEVDEHLEAQLRLDEGPICVYVGNIGLAQGLGTLLDIAKIRPKVRFLLFGDGADKVKLKMRAKEERIRNVEFCGVVDERGVRTVLRRATLSYVPLVNSCLKDSVPTKLYEALSCGCPVLLAAEGDAVDLLNECGLGGHATPEDSEALLSEFDRLIHGTFTQEQLNSAASWTLENHSRQVFARRFVEGVEALGGEGKSCDLR